MKLRKTLSYLFLVTLLTAFIYSFQFDVLLVSTKKILMLFGVVLSLRYFSHGYSLKAEYKKIIVLLISMCIWDIFISLINGQQQFHLISVVLPVIGSVFAAQLIYGYSRNIILNYEQFIKIISITVFFESSLAALIYFYPPAYEFVDSFIDFSFIIEGVSDITDMFRISGLGNAKYFGVLTSAVLGIFSSVSLIYMTDKPRYKLFYSISFLVIFSVSFLTARWTLTLGVISALLFIFYDRFKHIFKFMVLACILGIGIYFVFYVLEKYSDSRMFDWAFGFLSKDNNESDSHDQVLQWLAEASFSVKTLLLGDAQYSAPGGLYYGGVDVGFIRQIYYGGIFGLLLNLYIHYRILSFCYLYNNSRIYKGLYIAFFVGYLAMLLKGDADMMTFFILFLVFSTHGIFKNNLKYYTKK